MVTAGHWSSARGIPFALESTAPARSLTDVDRISPRRGNMTLKKSIRMKKQSRVTRSGRSKKAGRAPWWTDARAIGGAVVCIMAAAVVLAGYQSSDQADTASLHRKA